MIKELKNTDFVFAAERPGLNLWAVLMSRAHSRQLNILVNVNVAMSFLSLLINFSIRT